MKRKTQGTQIKTFKTTARELECDESEEAFDKALGKIGKAQAKKDKPKTEPR